jgi:aminoglycoside/choline kinase family phosphotransferase
MDELSRLNESVSSDSRHQVLAAWVQEQLGKSMGGEPGVISPLRLLNGDAGFRRYYRFDWHHATAHHCGGLLAVDAPPATEDSAQFVALAQYLRRFNVRTPSIFAVDIARGFLLVEDFGDALLQHHLNRETATTLYGEAFMTLLALQQSVDDKQLLPRYDQALLRRELTIFREWFVENLLDYTLNSVECDLLERFFTLLETSALAQPQVLVHRDYHSRNLLLCESGGMGVIDFQGALWGPCTYDAVSLLRDCYLRWPAADVKRWALAYGNLAMETGILPDVDEQTYLRWFDWMGLQRHIKVLGIFARLHLRDHKSGYLGDLSRVVGYVLEVAESYPELADFSRWFRAQLMPQVLQQPWYSAALFAGEDSL